MWRGKPGLVYFLIQILIQQHLSFQDLEVLWPVLRHGTQVLPKEINTRWSAIPAAGCWWVLWSERVCSTQVSKKKVFMCMYVCKCIE